MSEDPSEKKEEERDKKELTEFFGYVGIIIALTMTIAWDYVKSETQEVSVFFTTLYYLLCVLALMQFGLIFYSKYIGFEDFAKVIEGTISLPLFVLVPIFLSILPIFGLGQTNPAIGIALAIWMILFAGISYYYIRTWKGLKKDSENLSQD